MNSIRIWSINIVSVAFIACILRMLLPKGSLSSGVILGINLLTLLVVISPLSKQEELVPAFRFSSVEMVDFQVEEYALRVTKELTEKNIQTSLTELGIKEGSAVIDISMQTQPSSKTVISVIVPPEYAPRLGEIQKRLTQDAGMPVTVEISE